MEKERGGQAAGESGSGDGVGAKDELRARDRRERAGESSSGGATGSAGSWAEGAEPIGRGENTDKISINIMRKLDQLLPTRRLGYIFRVRHDIRAVNEKAYEPKLLSIGPYHYDKRRSKLQHMEEHKLRYLDDIIRRREERDGVSRTDQLREYLRVLEELKDRARGYYAEAVALEKDDFQEMLLLDGCFIIEQFRQATWIARRHEREMDPLFMADWIFQKNKFYDITFANGLLEIPAIKIDGLTEARFQNLIAYEEHGQGVSEFKYIGSYMSFMDGLVNTPKDVELLRHHGIFESYLSDDEAVATMFNSTGRGVIPDRNFYYKEIVNNLIKHCRKRRNVWMAKLRANYLSSPWKILSVLAASVLLVLTITQTIYSALSYYNAK
ncbi:uncharacterized protein LOC116214433 [Punica granatum]|uniref:Uncharacterized protein LOC116214433 n=1 Tax=Punica granatum TaxID=22663 RepID=A0A6P8EJ78_PUNGR|nr:uncharacterized protein LOC116214433 [Punica granatum]